MEILKGVSIAALADLAGVDRTTAMRWKTGRSRCPDAVLKLVTLRLDGDAAALLGPAWQGWRFGRDGLLYAPPWRRGFTPGELAALFFDCQQIRTLRAEAQQLRRDQERQQAEIERLQKACAFYRRQCSSEARFGMMLSRLAG